VFNFLASYKQMALEWPSVSTGLIEEIFHRVDGS